MRILASAATAGFACSATRAGDAKHAEVVGAITHGDGIVRRYPQRLCNVEQRIDLGLPSEDRFGNLAVSMPSFSIRILARFLSKPRTDAMRD